MGGGREEGDGAWGMSCGADARRTPRLNRRRAPTFAPKPGFWLLPPLGCARLENEEEVKVNELRSAP